MEPVSIVEAGYDEIADRFAAWQSGIDGSTALERVQELVSLLRLRPDVLELGCGAGTAATRRLADTGRLTGVDISAEQLRRACSRVPQATFVHADITQVAFEPATFDAVVALYVFNHVPQADLGVLVTRAAAWLRPGGHLRASFGAHHNAGSQQEWLGVPMYFAGCEPAENRRLVRRAGLVVVRDDLETITEPEPQPGDATFHWLLARKPISAAV